MMYAKDCYKGLKVGRLTLVKPVKWKPGKYTVHGWLCRCDCGNILRVRTNSIGHPTISCGCYNKDRISQHRYKDNDNYKDSRFYHLYRVYHSMLDRCYRKYCKDYCHYGKRGICVCDEWKKDYLNFKSWAIKAGYDTSKKGQQQSIDRIDVNGDYEPSNCRWVNSVVQANNKRNTNYITYNGEKLTITQWSKKLNMPRSLISDRYKRGWKAPAIFLPKGSHRNDVK